MNTWLTFSYFVNSDKLDHQLYNTKGKFKIILLIIYYKKIKYLPRYVVIVIKYIGTNLGANRLTSK